jgi:hypothetical protein
MHFPKATRRTVGAVRPGVVSTPGHTVRPGVVCTSGRAWCVQRVRPGVVCTSVSRPFPGDPWYKSGVETNPQPPTPNPRPPIPNPQPPTPNPQP